MQLLFRIEPDVGGALADDGRWHHGECDAESAVFSDRGPRRLP
jgi:hypothetical protein